MQILIFEIHIVDGYESFSIRLQPLITDSVPLFRSSFHQHNMLTQRFASSIASTAGPSGSRKIVLVGAGFLGARYVPLPTD